MNASKITRRGLAAAWLFVAVSCLRPSEREAELDRRVGVASSGDTSFVVEDGLAAIRRLDPGALVLWAQAPVLRIEARPGPAAPSEWVVEAHNVMPEARLRASSETGAMLSVTGLESEGETHKRWLVELVPGEVAGLVIAPPDADQSSSFRFAVLSDVQRALDDVEDIFRRMNEDPSIRFVISTGDLTQDGTREQYRELEQELAVLDVPLFSTIGNHENAGDTRLWHERFGPFNPQFIFRDVLFSLIDSSGATIDPVVVEQLEERYRTSPAGVRIFATHYPLFDPGGARHGGFRSRAEAAQVANILAEAGVNALFFGHIHSFESFSTADIPAYISGGGGAFPERLDGTGRHYLVVDVTPGEGVDQVGIIRISEDPLH